VRTYGLRFDVNCSILFTEPPGTGKLDHEALFRQLAAVGYAGWVGCEYEPDDPGGSPASFGGK
jgi:hydroxypyruvate isomerase